MYEKRGYVLEVEVTPGNVHDSVAFDTVFERLIEHYPQVEVITADAGYKTPWIFKQIIDSGRIPSLPYKRPIKAGNLPWDEYVYDEYDDCVLCPPYKVLKYASINREGYREYKSDGRICKDCPVRERCTQNKQCVKTVSRHIWQDGIEQAEDIRHSPRGRDLQASISNHCESLRGWQRKAWHALYAIPRAGRGYELGQAQICGAELKEAGHPLAPAHKKRTVDKKPRLEENNYGKAVHTAVDEPAALDALDTFSKYTKIPQS